MGYFNIFYKLTRIIDFFTRKRNQKFILAMCLIGGIVFFSPNVANADFTSTDSTTLTYMQVDVAGIRNYLNGWISTYLVLIQSNTNTTNERLTDIRGDLANQMTVLSTFATQLSNMRQDLIAMNGTLDHIDSDIHDLLAEIDSLLLKIDDLQDTISQILDTLESIDQNITYFGDLNHEDQEEIKELLKEYLYGDKGKFNVVGQNYGGLFFNQAQPVIRSTAAGMIWVFQIKEGYTYDFSFSAGVSANYIFYGFLDKKITPVARL